MRVNEAAAIQWEILYVSFQIMNYIKIFQRLITNHSNQ